MNVFNNDVEALTYALVLAVTAPSDEQAKQATAVADQIAAGMNELDIQKAKNAAESELASM